MPDDYTAKVRSLTPAKALAVAAYGESVAAYRYLTLTDKAPLDSQRKIFKEMAAEEQGHHMALQDLRKRHLLDSDFVLSPEDKELIIVGPRLLEVTDEASLEHAIGQIIDSERLTGRFYAALHEVTGSTELKPFLKEMADECFEHAERLEAMMDEGA
jgi:rubrerythrin